MSDIALRASHVSKRFVVGSHVRAGIKDRLLRRVKHQQEVWALRDASFEVRRGECVGIIGHNGAGKSTALKVLAGIYLPTNGTVDVRGRVSALLELGAGFHGDLTGRENISLNGAILGLSKKQIRAAEDRIIDFADIGPHIDLPVKTYSSGMSMRLGFAITANLDPEILIVDEVIAVGDESFRLKCNSYMESLRDIGTTILMVSHALPTVATMCDTVIWLDHGQVVGYGPAPDVVDSYVSSVIEERQRAATRAEGHTGVDSQDLLTLSGVQFFDASGNAVETATSGLPLVVRVHYHCAAELGDVEFGFGMRQAGAHQGAAAAFTRSEPRLVEQGPGYADYEVSHLTLVPGTYAVSLGAERRGVRLAVVVDATTIEIVAPSARFSTLPDLPGHWKA